MPLDEYVYVGSELETFSHARNWKRYWSGRLAPYLRGLVLEVGAGLGANSAYLVTPEVSRIVCLEPDARLLRELRCSAPPNGAAREVLQGTLQDLNRDRTFDTIVYVDVLEHIEDDRAELADAAARLRSGGDLVVLAPAFPILYSEFDRAVGHHRRYTR